MSKYRGIALGGALAIDFCNTVDSRPGFLTDQMVIDGEHFKEVSHIIEWALAAKALTERETNEILMLDDKRRALFLKQTIEVREQIFNVMLESTTGRGIQPQHLAALDHYLETFPRPKLIYRNGRVERDWEITSRTCALLLTKIITNAINILVSDSVKRVKFCAASDCGWLFVDTSKNNSRRWCDMADCGNRAKARQFYSKLEKRKS
jgi:predicted RNA-binding Zn ribbon-like protein